MPLQHVGFIELPAARRTAAASTMRRSTSPRAGSTSPTPRTTPSTSSTSPRRSTSAPSRDLTAVAGALVAEARISSSRRTEARTRSACSRRATVPRVDRIAVGVRPNGLAYDPRRARLLVAHVGDPAIPGSMHGVDRRRPRAEADRRRARRRPHAVDRLRSAADAFHVNIADPPQIVVVEAGDPAGIRRVVPIPHAGPHGLDIDVARRRLFCACDAGVVLEVDADTRHVLGTETDRRGSRRRVPRCRAGAASTWRSAIRASSRSSTRRRSVATRPIPTELGAHTLSFDAARHIVCAFLPGSHRAAVYEDRR